MPDGRTHKLVGAGLGAVYVGYRAKEQPDLSWWIEVFGGAVGGYLGGACPDILEPAVSSWHRGTAHSCAAGSGVIAIRNGLEAFAKACRENSEKSTAVEMIPSGNIFIPSLPDPFSLLLSKLFSLLWLFLAGLVNGFAAGYVSHLVLDGAIGKRSIPLLKKGL